MKKRIGFSFKTNYLIDKQELDKEDFDLLFEKTRGRFLKNMKLMRECQKLKKQGIEIPSDETVRDWTLEEKINYVKRLLEEK